MSLNKIFQIAFIIIYRTYLRHCFQTKVTVKSRLSLRKKMSYNILAFFLCLSIFGISVEAHQGKNFSQNELE